MTSTLIFDFVGLLLAGLLAGEEFVVCYGVRTPLAIVDDEPQIKFRQNLIRRLRVLVPSIAMPSLFCSLAILWFHRAQPGILFQGAGVAAMLTWLVTTFAGTVPINEAVLTWSPDAPPENWKLLMARWEQLDIIRCWVTVLAFTCFLLSAALRLTTS